MAMKVGEMLVSKELITSEQLKLVLKEQHRTGDLLGQTLSRMGYMAEEKFLLVLSEQLNIPFIKIRDVDIDTSVIKKLPPKFAWHYKIIPISYADKKLTVATFDPLGSLNDVKKFLGCEIVPVLATESDLTKAIEKYYGVGAETIEKIIASTPKESVVIDTNKEVTDIEKMAGDASVVKLVNQIIVEAYQKRATDIHIDLFRSRMSLRYRIDGILYEANTSEDMVRFFPAIISRIKIMSNLNIVERRMPQDGRAVVKIGDIELDLRISIIPTRYGEGLVIRILPTKMLFSLKGLGLQSTELKVLEDLIHKPHGIIFATGPTGSGKTTTLYACLNKIKSTENKIITLEDPIEYELEGITQIQVMPEIGLTFAQGLRSVLRHDPDIMMVGEVRDFETAELAIRIALTGHLIFSTVHTNDAAGGVTRLLDMGVEPFLITSSVRGFIAQRLLRVICPDCKEEDTTIGDDIKKQMLEEIAEFRQFYRKSPEKYEKFANLKESDIHFYRGRGCEACNSNGFRDRTAIYEILVVNKAIKDLIQKKVPTDTIREEAIKQGMKTLRLAGWERVIEGITTPAEVIRITQVEE
ncbi:MAG: ATPase, T2SS/T4P/T4SS family [Candidatus Orphnella occulta]|nr:ATPase, T2SS/T4P/T4SS family [Candidatus Orphnella occulta]